MSKLDWSKLDCEDGINEEWWNKEMAKPIPELKPIPSRVKLPDPETWDLHTEDAQDPRIRWEVDLHNTLVAVRYLLDENKAHGWLPESTVIVLDLAQTLLELEFPKTDHQGEKPF